MDIQILNHFWMTCLLCLLDFPKKKKKNSTKIQIKIKLCFLRLVRILDFSFLLNFGFCLSCHSMSYWTYQSSIEYLVRNEDPTEILFFFW